MKILAIGAHFDDVEVGCGGTLLKYCDKNYEIFVAITHSSEFRTGDPGVRLKEQYESCEILCCRKNLRLFIPSDKMADIIGDLDKIKPDIIYAPYHKDTHQDHVYASKIGLAVGRHRNMNVFFYDSGSAYDFNPTSFSVINHEKKGFLIKCFDSQLKKMVINLGELKQKELNWGYLTSEVGCYAEGFVIHRMRHIV